MEAAVKSGAAVRTRTLDLTAAAECNTYRAVDGTTRPIDPANDITDTTEGWCWLASTRGLTLCGAHIIVLDTTLKRLATAIKLPGDAKLILSDNTHNVVINGKAAINKSAGIYAHGRLEISGNGSLIAIGGCGTVSYGIRSLDVIFKDSPAITALGGKATDHSFGICCNHLLVRDDHGAIINATIYATDYVDMRGGMIIAQHDEPPCKQPRVSWGVSLCARRLR